MDQSKDRSRQIAWLLSLAGLIPFWALSLFLIAADSGEQYETRYLIGYGAVILSFLGGIRWGLALANEEAEDGLTYGLSVIPSLVGWACLLVPAAYALPILALCFGLQWLWDFLSTRKGIIPHWFGSLRSVISVGAILALLLALFGIN